MFTFQAVGFVRGTYTDRKSGALKPFTRIYCTYDLADGSYSSCEVDGYGTDVIFIGRILDDISVGDEFRPIYNKYGTCIDIQIL